MYSGISVSNFACHFACCKTIYILLRCLSLNMDIIISFVNLMHTSLLQFAAISCQFDDTVQHFDHALVSSPLLYLCLCKPWHSRYAWSLISHHTFWLVIWCVLYLWVAMRRIFFSQNAPLYPWKQRIRTYSCLWLPMPIWDACFFASSVSFQDYC